VLLGSICYRRLRLADDLGRSLAFRGVRFPGLLRIAMLRIILIAIALLATPTIVLAQSESQTEAEKLHRVGYNFFIQGDYRKALEAFQKELPLRRAMHDKSGEAWSLNQIGRRDSKT